MDEAYELSKGIAWRWTMQCWGETKDSNGDALVCIPELVQHDLRLQYTEAEASASDDLIMAAKGDKCKAIQTVLHEWHLA